MGSGLHGSGWLVSSARRRCRLARRVTLASLAASNLGLAAPLALDLDWRAPAGCPDRNVMRRYVEEMLGSSELATSSLSARGGVARIATDRWTADLSLRSSSGSESTRSFEGPTCESVSRAAALVMALTLHPNEAPIAPANPERDARPPERPIVGRFVRPEIAPSAALDVGSTPGSGVAYGGALALGWSPFAAIRWEIFAAYFAPRRGTLANDNALGADVSLAALGIRGCYPVVDAAVSFAPCIGGGLDWLRASGFGARKPLDGSAFTANLETGGIILWNFTEFASARLAVQGVIPLARPEFFIDAVDGRATVYRRTPLALRVTGGVELHF